MSPRLWAERFGQREQPGSSDRTVGEISQNELRSVLETKKSRDRFDEAITLIDGKLRRISEVDAPVDYVLVVIPDDLYRKSRVVDYRDKGPVHRDLRRVLKARAMHYRAPTQLLRESTILRNSDKGLDHEATVAWNLFTGMYFKAGGTP